jgi:hypothetical protein
MSKSRESGDILEFSIIQKLKNTMLLYDENSICRYNKLKNKCEKNCI